jgi:macrolide-specific efflux system membrane fusion protein
MVLKLVEQVDVPARETGVLARMQTTEGQIVAAGDPLAQIDDAEARLALQRAKLEIEIAQRNAANDASVRLAKKTVEVARAELQRSVDSNARYSKSVSDSEMDRLRLLVDKGQLEVEQAEHELALAGATCKIKQTDLLAAEEKLTRHRIAAPLAGQVVQIYRHAGEWVKPGEPVVRILRLDRLRAEGFINAQDIHADLKGRAVKLVIDLPDEPARVFRGKISFIDPQIDPIVAQTRIWADLENEGLKLRPGLRAKMTIEP